MQFLTNLFSSNKPNTFLKNINYKEAYLEYINTARNLVKEVYSNYHDTLNKYVDNSIEIGLNQFLGSGLTKIILPKITSAIKQISSKAISFVDSYVESYVQSAKDNIEISKDYFSNALVPEQYINVVEEEGLEVVTLGITDVAA